MSDIVQQAWNGTLTEARLAANDHAINTLGSPPLPVTPLAAACENGHLDVVRLLLRYGADPNIPSPQGTPLIYATAVSPSLNRLAIVRELISAGANIEAQSTDGEGNTPLINAVISVRDKAVVNELVDNGASLTATNARGQTAVKLAKGTGLEGELRPRIERNAALQQIIDQIALVVVLIITYLNSQFIKSVACGVAKKLKKELPNSNSTTNASPVPLFGQLKTAVEKQSWK